MVRMVIVELMKQSSVGDDASVHGPKVGVDYCGSAVRCG